MTKRVCFTIFALIGMASASFAQCPTQYVQYASPGSSSYFLLENNMALCANQTVLPTLIGLDGAHGITLFVWAPNATVQIQVQMSIRGRLTDWAVPIIPTVLNGIVGGKDMPQAVPLPVGIHAVRIVAQGDTEAIVDVVTVY